MRTFIAIELSDDTKKALAAIQNELMAIDADVKWVNPENIHLTLKFLGEVGDDAITDLSGVLDSVADCYKKFDISLFKVGAFPKLDYPRVIWVGIDNNCAIVEEITAKIDNECEKLGFVKEKRGFSAHITLGRVRSLKNKSTLKEKILAIDIKPLSSAVNELTIFKSTLTPKGPVYIKIHASDLV